MQHAATTTGTRVVVVSLTAPLFDKKVYKDQNSHFDIIADFLLFLSLCIFWSFHSESSVSIVKSK
jgi:hypothetical protein